MKRRLNPRTLLAHLAGSLVLVSCSGDPVDDIDEPLSLEPEGEPLDATSALATDRHTSAAPGFELEIAVAGDDVVLSWVAAPDTEYEVWRTHAFVEPLVGASGSTLLAAGSGLATYTDVGVADRDAPTPIVFYQLRATGPAGEQTSTIVAKVSAPAAAGYTKLGLCLLGGPVTASELYAELGSAVQSVYTWDELGQAWRTWTPGVGGPFGDLSLPLGGVVAVRFDGTVTPYVSLVGTVPTDEPRLQPVDGLNLLSTPIAGPLAGSALVEGESLTAYNLVDGFGWYDGVGRWDPVTQTSSWYRGPSDQDFAIEHCHPYYFEGAPSVAAASDGPYFVAADETLVVDAADGVLANDQGYGGWALTVASHDEVTAEGGTVTVAPDGSFVYEPPAGFLFGTDRFSYVATNSAGETASTDVRVVVQAVGGAVSLAGLGTQGVRLPGIAADDDSGWSSAGAGDVNGDGYADIIVGARYASHGFGESYLVYGGPTLPTQIPLADADVRFQSTALEAAGASVAGAGDVDDDGYADLLIGGAGATYLVLGGPNLPDTIGPDDAAVRFVEIDPGDMAGWRVSSAGDVNGDGYSDVLIGAFAAQSYTGEAYLVYGGRELPPEIQLADADVRFAGVGSNTWAGASLAAAGDVNGDGYDDVIIGAFLARPNGSSHAGESYLVLGGPALPASIGLGDADVRFEGIGSTDNSGFDVGGAGDVNGDGYADVIIGAGHRSEGMAFDRGQAYVVYGGPGLPAVIGLADADVILDGVDADDRAGSSVGVVGDVDADGYADLLIGAPQAESAMGAPFDGGETYLVRGGPDLAAVIDLADADLRLDGVDVLSHSGNPTRPAGDVDGDGYADFLIGAGGASPGGAYHAGETYLVYGADLLGRTTVPGTDGADDLWSTISIRNDILVGGRGDDLLHTDNSVDGIQAQTSDVVRGGEGDDRIVILGSADFFRIDGGLGCDTLQIITFLDLTLISPQGITGIERILLGPDTPPLRFSWMFMTELDLLDLSDTSNTLVVDSLRPSGVNLLSGTWTGPVMDGGYAVYASTTTSAVLRLGPAVNLATPGAVLLPPGS